MALACAALPFSNPDLYWHLSAARRIVETGAAPRADWLSFTMAARPWVDFEWLTELIWLGALRAGGFWALWALKASLWCAAGALLWLTAGLYGLSAEARAPWLAAWALALLPSDDLRPENFSVALFALEWWWLERDRLRGRPASALDFAGAAGLFALWANLHAGFAYGLALAAACAALAPAGRRGRLAALTATACAATLLNPYGWRLYPVLARHAADAPRLSGLIREWGAPPLSDPWLSPFWAVLAASALCLGLGLAGRQPRRAGHRRGYGEAGRATAGRLAIVAALGLSALRHVRTIPYFCQLAVPSAALALGNPSTRVRRAAGAGAAAAAAAFCLFMVAPRLRGAPYLPRYAPAGAADFLGREAAALGGKRLFHPPEWGGYLGWRLWPRYAVLADGRYLFHPLFADVDRARRTPEAFGAYLAAQGIDLALVRPDPRRLQVPAELGGATRVLVWRPLYLFFLPKAEWALVYYDAQAMLFARRGAVPAEWLGLHEYKLFRPGDEEAARLMVDRGVAKAGALEAERRRHGAETR